MDYVTKYYKTLSEELQKKLNLLEMETTSAVDNQSPKQSTSPTQVDQTPLSNPNVWENRPPPGDNHEPGMEYYQTFEEWYTAWIYWWMTHGGGFVGRNYDMENFNENDLNEIREYLKKLWEERFRDRRKRPQYGPPGVPLEWLERHQRNPRLA